MRCTHPELLGWVTSSDGPAGPASVILFPTNTITPGNSPRLFLAVLQVEFNREPSVFIAEQLTVTLHRELSFLGMVLGSRTPDSLISPSGSDSY